MLTTVVVKASQNQQSALVFCKAPSGDQLSEEHLRRCGAGVGEAPAGVEAVGGQVCGKDVATSL